MRRSGPLLTLLVGLVLGVGLLVLSMNATNGDPDEQAAAGTAASASPTATATVPPAPTEPPKTAEAPAPAPEAPATYAGRVDGGAATVAIAINGGQAVAYVCDGRQIEAWLQGPASGGTMALIGAGGANLTGTYGNGVSAGSVAADGKAWTFTAPVAQEPAGLYRATATVAGARVVGGWIVLPDGSQVGVMTEDGRRAPAPSLDVATGQASVEGTPIAAERIDGEPIAAEPSASTSGS
jgi:hypothetical protein